MQASTTERSTDEHKARSAPARPPASPEGVAAPSSQAGFETWGRLQPGLGLAAWLLTAGVVLASGAAFLAPATHAAAAAAAPTPQVTLILTADPQQGSAPLPVIVRGFVKVPAGVPSYRKPHPPGQWLIEFGDGTTPVSVQGGLRQQFTHVYEKPGTYPVFASYHDSGVLVGNVTTIQVHPVQGGMTIQTKLSKQPPLVPVNLSFTMSCPRLAGQKVVTWRWFVYQQTPAPARLVQQGAKITGALTQFTPPAITLTSAGTYQVYGAAFDMNSNVLCTGMKDCA
jgi:hypothetical protein